MNVYDLFIARYEALYSFHIHKIWENLSHAQMRQQPHPRLNTVVWNLWHLTRAEDAGLNRFVTDRTQVLDEGNWNAELNLSIRHVGTGMSDAEVLELSKQIDLVALKGYSEAIHKRTLEIVPSLTSGIFDETLDESYRHSVAVDEGYANPSLPWMVSIYQDWTKGKCLMHLGLTHSFEHIGVIGTISSLMDVDVFEV